MKEIEYPIKININIPVTGKLKKEVKKSNILLTDSIINFNNGMHIPHITLIMGHVNSENDFNKIIEIVSRFSKEVSSFKYSVEELNISRSKNGYFFADVSSVKIEKIKRLLYSRVSDLIEVSTFGGSENKPHITLGFIENCQKTELSPFLSKLTPLGYASRIAISQAGPKGTCLNILKYFHFNRHTLT